MSEPVPEQTPDTPDAEASRIQTLDERFQRLEDMIKNAVSGGGSGSETAPETPDVASEVRSELAKLKQAEDRKAARDKEKSDAEARLAAVEEKVKEKPPQEYRRVTNFMGWSGKKDDQK